MISDRRSDNILTLHCWFDFDDGEWLDDDTKTPSHTCMLEADHDGPHEPTPDDKIVIGFLGEVD